MMGIKVWMFLLLLLCGLRGSRPVWGWSQPQLPQKIAVNHRARLYHSAPREGSTVRAVESPSLPTESSPPTATEQVESLSSSASSSWRTLYPPATLIREGTLAVDPTHTLFYQEYGKSHETTTTSSNSQSYPPTTTALVLHGGPGAGCFPNHARFFDPDRYDRIILLDQRGSGRSTPRGSLVNQTLTHLVYDCEALRQHLQIIPHWNVVLGGSWGSTLALAYAQTFPKSVKALVLRGVCLLRHPEVDWLFGEQPKAASALDPEGWNAFANAVSAVNTPTPEQHHQQADYYSDTSDHHRRRVLHAYYDRLLGPDPVLRALAARNWMQWEMRVSRLAKRQKPPEQQQGGVLEEQPRRETLAWKPDSSSWQLQYETEQQDLAVEAISEENAQHYMDRIRRGIMTNSYNEERQFTEDSSVQTQQSTSHHYYRPVHELYVSQDEARRAAQFAHDQPQILHHHDDQHIPEQALLTCFYSVNCQAAMNYIDLLSPQRMQRLRLNIPCIAVQGGSDSICPPDTALDLWASWPEMELRIPLQAGHSMYDPAITHELIEATDRIVSKRHGDGHFELPTSNQQQ